MCSVTFCCTWHLTLNTFKAVRLWVRVRVQTGVGLVGWLVVGV